MHKLLIRPDGGLPRTCGTRPMSAAPDCSTTQGGSMFTPKGRALLWHKPTGYGASHCQKCKAGWTRSGKDGAALTVCLLDREPILTEMTDCDRHEPREQA